MQQINSFSLGAKIGFAAVIAAFMLSCSLTNQINKSELVSETPTAEVTLSATPTIVPDDGSRYRVEGCNPKYGYINRQGQLVIPHQFLDAGNFSEGLAVVSATWHMEPKVGAVSDYGYIDQNGRYLIEPNFVAARPFSEGLAAAVPIENPGAFGYIDNTGKFVIEPKYIAFVGFVFNTPYSLNDFREGYALVPYDREIGTGIPLWTYINRTGKKLDPPGLLYGGTSFSEGLAIINTKSRQTFVIDASGQTIAQVTDCQFGYCNVGLFSEGLAPLSRAAEGKLAGFIDKEGNRVISEQFASVKGFSEGLAAVQDTKTKLWGYVDHSGNLVIPFRFASAGMFSEELAAVEEDGGGYIDKTGNMVIHIADFTFPDTDISVPVSSEAFHQGLAFVGNGYIDETGKYVYQFQTSECK